MLPPKIVPWANGCRGPDKLLPEPIFDFLNDASYAEDGAYKKI